jgi:hypothetical protein
MFIQDPGSKNSNKREGGKIVVLPVPLFVATTITKLKLILFFELVKKKFGPICKEL